MQDRPENPASKPTGTPAPAPQPGTAQAATPKPAAPPPPLPPEVGGPQGPEPTRYGDWERKGRVSDF